jgi:hypothetical protein
MSDWIKYVLGIPVKKLYFVKKAPFAQPKNGFPWAIFRCVEGAPYLLKGCPHGG